MEWLKGPFSKYTQFDGRATRQEYWMWQLCLFGVAVLIWILALVIHPIFLVVWYIAAALTIIPGISVLVRRLHDTGSSGGWVFISLIPFLGGIALLFLLVKDGDAGPNKYGSDPKMRVSQISNISNPSTIQDKSDINRRENLLSSEPDLPKPFTETSDEVRSPPPSQPRPIIKMDKPKEVQPDPPIFE